MSAMGGRMDGLAVLDLFAGSGALGLEALSRGAAHATLVESAASAARVITEQVRVTQVVDLTSYYHTAAEAEADLGLASDLPTGVRARAILSIAESHEKNTRPRSILAF